MVGRLASRQRPDLVGLAQPLDEMPTDEAGAAGDEDPHLGKVETWTPSGNRRRGGPAAAW
jgi:hypothetical protein